MPSASYCDGNRSWFIFGMRDNSIPANLLAFMAERAGSKKTVTIEGASHAVMISHADAVVELVVGAYGRRNREVGQSGAAFIAAQLAGALAAVGVSRWLWRERMTA